MLILAEIKGINPVVSFCFEVLSTDSRTSDYLYIFVGVIHELLYL